eukprot:4320735-Pleurochrysis_carterae.AAC.1
MSLKLNTLLCVPAESVSSSKSKVTDPSQLSLARDYAPHGAAQEFVLDETHLRMHVPSGSNRCMLLQHAPAFKRFAKDHALATC